MSLQQILNVPVTDLKCSLIQQLHDTAPLIQITPNHLHPFPIVLKVPRALLHQKSTSKSFTYLKLLFYSIYLPGSAVTPHFQLSPPYLHNLFLQISTSMIPSPLPPSHLPLPNIATRHSRRQTTMSSTCILQNDP